MPYAAHASLGIYLSVPFCRSKCTYCNFASGVYPAGEMERYIARVIADLREARALAALLGAELPERVGSVYFGGGTPSLLPPAALRPIFQAIRACFVLEPAAEITLECAPGQLADETLAATIECGVNRVSLGVQSFVDAEARAGGRLHTHEVVLNEIARLRTAGITNLSVDLIAGLPHQTAASWQESLACLVESGVPHASVYMLEVDEDSRLGRELLDGGTRYSAGLVPKDAAIAAMYERAVEELARAGYESYEISNFAEPGMESAHNLRYWLRQPYLGVGLDASSMLRAADGDVLRLSTTDDLRAYAEATSFAAALEEKTRIRRGQQLEEALFLGLRLRQGIALEELLEEFGAMAEEYRPLLRSQLADGLLEEAAGRLRLTMRGRLLSNNVFAAYLREEAELKG